MTWCFGTPLHLSRGDLPLMIQHTVSKHDVGSNKSSVTAMQFLDNITLQTVVQFFGWRSSFNIVCVHIRVLERIFVIYELTVSRIMNGDEPFNYTSPFVFIFTVVLVTFSGVGISCPILRYHMMNQRFLPIEGCAI